MSNQIVFGAGSLFVKDKAAQPKSTKIATLQEVSFDLSEDDVELYASSKFPIHVAPSKGKAGGKIKVASYEKVLAGAVMGGATTSTGYEAMAVDEAFTIPATPGPYTSVATHAADYAEDYGITYVATGLPLTRVATAPALGQYAVDEATGTYTFAAADQGKPCLRSYSYDVTGSGETVDVKNVLMGTGSTFTLFGWNDFDGRKFGYKFPNVRIKGFSASLKPDAHMTPEHEFKAYADPGQTVFKLFVA
jgi:hypothetical protein